MDRLRKMTHAAASGRRGRLLAKVERPLARRTPLSPDTIRSLVGALLLLSALKRLLRALRAGLR